MTYAEPAVCIVRLDEDVGVRDLTANGVTNAVEDAIRVGAAPRNTWVATMLLRVVVDVRKEANKDAGRLDYTR